MRKGAASDRDALLAAGAHATVIQVRTDLINPGQFFAACGLLTIAGRLDADAYGWFDWPHDRPDEAVFSMTTRTTLKKVLAAALEAPAKSDQPLVPITDISDKEGSVDRIAPVEIGDPLHMRLAWWLDETAGTTTSLKLWAAKQSPLQTVAKLRKAGSADAAAAGLFDSSKPLRGRFGLDPRSGWRAIDVGWSPHALDMPVATYWAVELLAAFGLSAMPCRAQGRRFFYRPWRTECAWDLISSAATADCPEPGSVYSFGIIPRGKFGTFGYAQPNT